MAVNKVEINGEVKLDLTQDTVTENTLLKGVTAHDAAGNSVEGKVVTTPVPVTSNLLKGDGAGGVSAATPGTDYLTEAPVTSVNGATGDVKSTFYVTVTQEGDYTATADKTGEEVYAAYAAGYAVYAIVNLNPDIGDQLILPMTAALKDSSQVLLAFITLTEFRVVFVQYSNSAWFVADATLAYSEDIPTIPEYLPNPNALNIKIGDTTTSYDGSAAKTVEIPEGVPSVTTADNGKFLRVVNGAWAAAAIDNANGGSF